ncbi:MAG: AAA family ATPase [Nostocales cyanobacterium LE14-WE4]|jgi:predicted ATP-dependent endonuclease of OLD family|nr:AAA family ATPase [Anabaena sp. 49633_E8]MCE2701122.1 AAA family ATPase [Anabaena sp. 49633_E8]MDJ0501678.1 AAA family ATPase [Nostocales cyanobacterium LE14-WE4]
MKIQSLKLKHFKKFRDQELDFTDPETGLAQDLIVLIGMNGAGKTSILQAIAAILGTATGRLKKPADLDWPGFNYDLLGRNWRGFPSHVTINIQFSKSELQAVGEFQQKLQELGRDLLPPAQKHLVTLKWQGDDVKADSAAELFQFKGREYAKQLFRSEGFPVFERVGTVFWYTEQRTATSLTPEDPENKLEITEDLLRARLARWQTVHQKNGKNFRHGQKDLYAFRPGQKDLYAEMERIYQAVFPGRVFQGVEIRDNIDEIFSKEPWFYLYDGKNYYEISEMSGGERAIFPMLIDFMSWNIHNSVILIDEIELHLHPPMQQALLRALPKLGKNNQFIITTHSDYVAQLVPESSIIRIEE